MNEPDFLIIGAARSGTSTLYNKMKIHPDIYMLPIKEPNFFALSDASFDLDISTTSKNYRKTFIYTKNDYLKLFQNAKSSQLCGEASPIYLWYKNAAKNIYQFNKDMKIIVILRNPIERAFSNFNYNLKEGNEITANFRKALLLEESRIENKYWWGYYYVDAGYYFVQLKRYFSFFPKENIKVILFDEFKSNARRVFKEIFLFLNVSDFEIDNLDKTNESFTPKIYFINRFKKNDLAKKFARLFITKNIRQKIKLYNKNKKTISIRDREFLKERYNNDMNSLENMIEKKIYWESE